jgi:hypothetical protein
MNIKPETTFSSLFQALPQLKQKENKNALYVPKKYAFTHTYLSILVVGNIEVGAIW